MELDIVDSLPLILFTALASLLVLTAIRKVILSDNIPVINGYSGDLLRNRAHTEFLQNARELIAQGVTRFDGPFRVIITLGSRVILPARYTEWVKDCKDLDHPALVADE